MQSYAVEQYVKGVNTDTCCTRVLWCSSHHNRCHVSHTRAKRQDEVPCLTPFKTVGRRLLACLARRADRDRRVRPGRWGRRSEERRVGKEGRRGWRSKAWKNTHACAGRQ